MAKGFTRLLVRTLVRLARRVLVADRVQLNLLLVVLCVREEATVIRLIRSFLALPANMALLREALANHRRA